MITRNRLMLAALLCLAGTLSALDIEYDPGITAGLVNQVLDEIGGMYTNPQNLIKGFADALVFAGHGATQRAYGDTEHIALTIGAMAGLRTGERVFNAETFADAADTLLDEGDYTFGLNVQTLAFQCGVTLSRLHLGFRVGGTNLTAVENLTLSTITLGLLGHYQVIEGRAPAGHETMFRWRGLSLGTGLLYQRAELRYAYDFNDFVESTLTARDPTLEFDMTATIVTVPVELNTAALFLYVFNVSAGVGADISFGKNDASVRMNTDVFDDTGAFVGELRANGGGTARPLAVSPKVMGSVGFKAGPVALDIPFAYYFVGGFQAGLTVGVCL